FFQAEDGIRDFHVTGVQTCALPIYELSPFVAHVDRHRRREQAVQRLDERLEGVGRSVGRRPVPGDSPARHRRPEGPLLAHRYRKIGRASCRERAWITVGGSTLEGRE